MTERASVALSKGGGSPDPLIGRVINDRFKITSLIARGGMGRVYRAEQAPLGRACAVKVLHPSYVGEHDPEFHKRFFLEASIASKLTHPNTVTIFDYGRTEDDVYYMAMELLAGHTLHRAIRQAGYLPEGRAAHIARQICRALREAHALGVIHRDLKPANVFLVEHGDEADFVKVLDFGLVKQVSDTRGEDLTQAGLFMGSPKYMAPEQIRGDRVDARTDVYALGVILYEMLTGKVPFDRTNSVTILMAHVHDDAPPMREVNPKISLSAPLEETVLRCMAKDPDQRFRSMDEVLAALKRIDGSHTQTLSLAGTDPYRVLAASVSGPQARTPTGSTSGPKPALVPAGAVGLEGAPSLLASPNDSPAAGSTSGSLSVQFPPKGGSKGVLLGAIGGALAVAGIAGFVALRPSRIAPVSAQSAVAAAGSPRSAPSTSPSALASVVAAPAAPEAAVAKVHVETEPEGATVDEEGVELCSNTPCDVVYKGASADPSRQHELTLALAGYRNETKRVKPGDDPVYVKLTPTPAAPRYRPSAMAAPHEAPPAADAPRVPPGYKTDIPY